MLFSVLNELKTTFSFEASLTSRCRSVQCDYFSTLFKTHICIFV